MEGRKLLQALMDHAEPPLNSNSLAKRLGNSSLQAQIHRFLSGKLKEPRRETLKPVADFFMVPVEAFYSPGLALHVAGECGFDDLVASEETEVLTTNYDKLFSKVVADMQVSDLIRELSVAVAKLPPLARAAIRPLIDQAIDDPSKAEAAGSMVDLIIFGKDGKVSLVEAKQPQRQPAPAGPADYQRATPIPGPTPRANTFPRKFRKS